MRPLQQRYAGCMLDRAGSFRQDPLWIARRLASPRTRFLPLWRNRNLVSIGNGAREVPALIAFTRRRAGPILDAAGEIVFLGLDSGAAVFAADLSSLGRDDAGALGEGAEFLDLRRVGPAMREHEAALAAYARGALRWHRYSRYCGHCGAASESRNGGHLRVCGNVDCRREIHPRTDPAVIMLVEFRPPDGSAPECLLAHHHRSPPGGYSTLAGFVEPGESLEDAVRREVFEEAGVRVGGVTYQGSQPWPFPSSIMLAFRARALTRELNIDRNEIGDACWFRPDELLAFGEWGDAAAGRRLSPKDSIARYLIDSWLRETTVR